MDERYILPGPWEHSIRTLTSGEAPWLDMIWAAHTVGTWAVLVAISYILGFITLMEEIQYGRGHAKRTWADMPYNIYEMGLMISGLALLWPITMP